MTDLNQNQQRTQSLNLFVFLALGMLSALTGVAAGASAYTHINSNPAITAREVQFDQSNKDALQPMRPSVVYSGQDFKALWEYVQKTKVNSEQVDVFSDEQANSHLYELGEERGYQKQKVIDESQLGSIFSQRMFILKAVDEIQTLLLDSRSSGSELYISSTYRSTKRQKELFIDRFKAVGGDPNDVEGIANGAYDTQLQATYDLVAPPGYSKHHTGQAIDFCDETSRSCRYRFVGTRGHSWLVADNFQNARNYGLIPSYPDDVENQGPNPEPWEFTWIGSDNINLRTLVEAWK